MASFYIFPLVKDNDQNRKNSPEIARFYIYEYIYPFIRTSASGQYVDWQIKRNSHG